MSLRPRTAPVSSSTGSGRAACARTSIRLDDWAKDVAPSAELRTWYGHDPAKFSEFRQRYLRELAGSPQRAALGRLRALAAAGRPVTLLTATRDVEHSQAAVLAQLLRQAARAASPKAARRPASPTWSAPNAEPWSARAMPKAAAAAATP